MYSPKPSEFARDLINSEAPIQLDLREKPKSTRTKLSKLMAEAHRKGANNKAISAIIGENLRAVLSYRTAKQYQLFVKLSEFHPTNVKNRMINQRLSQILSCYKRESSFGEECDIYFLSPSLVDIYDENFVCKTMEFPWNLSITLSIRKLEEAFERRMRDAYLYRYEFKEEFDRSKEILYLSLVKEIFKQLYAEFANKAVNKPLVLVKKTDPLYIPLTAALTDSAKYQSALDIGKRVAKKIQMDGRKADMAATGKLVDMELEELERVLMFEEFEPVGKIEKVKSKFFYGYETGSFGFCPYGSVVCVHADRDYSKCLSPELLEDKKCFYSKLVDIFSAQSIQRLLAKRRKIGKPMPQIGFIIDEISSKLGYEFTPMPIDTQSSAQKFDMNVDVLDYCPTYMGLASQGLLPQPQQDIAEVLAVVLCSEWDRSSGLPELNEFCWKPVSIEIDNYRLYGTAGIVLRHQREFICCDFEAAKLYKGIPLQQRVKNFAKALGIQQMTGLGFNHGAICYLQSPTRSWAVETYLINQNSKHYMDFLLKYIACYSTISHSASNALTRNCRTERLWLESYGDKEYHKKLGLCDACREMRYRMYEKL